MKGVWASTSRCHPHNQVPSAPHKATPPQPQPAGGKTCTLNTYAGHTWVRRSVGPRLGVHASLRACRDRRAGQSSGENRVSGRAWVPLGLEWREKGSEGRFSQSPDVGRGPPTCTPPPLSPWGRQEAAHPRVPSWGRGAGCGYGWGEAWGHWV